MTLERRFLQYPKRQYGMDHDRYSWSMLSTRDKVEWPNGAKLGLWVNVAMQYFPLNQQGKPFQVPGGMTMPYPDLRHYSLRDYGNRVGIFRFLKAFDQYKIKPSFAFNSRLAERTPYLIDMIKERGDEIACHGLHMDALHYGGQDKRQEREQIKSALGSLRELSGQDVIGWISPARSESENTPDLLAENGIKYFSDWVNDDMPFWFRTRAGNLMAMPLSNELDDQFILHSNLHSEQSYVEQVCDACDFLLEEAQTQGGRILGLNIHPWMLGQPHRIGKLEAVLEYISSQPGVCSVNGAQIYTFLNNNLNNDNEAAGSTD